MIRKLSVLLVLLLAAAALQADTLITWNQWPYGVRYIGGYAKWWMSPDGSSITVPVFNPDDTVWDMTSIGGSAVSHDAQSWIMLKSAAQGSPPSQCTYAEKQIQNGQVSWGYESMDTTGANQYMWLYGFYTQGTQVDYDSPYQRVYHFPMHVGDNWTEAWTWQYLGVDQVSETRNNYVVARGWVKVEADTSRYYPCLVLRTYSTSTDEYGYINEQRVIHEWDVPDLGRVGGSVCTIQSTNGVTSPDFTTAEHIFRMKEFHSVFDNLPPNFAGTTQVPSGYNLGPFAVSSTITDASGVRKDSLYYRIGAGSWQSIGRDSLRGTRYYFHIPQLSATDSVSYYLTATDTAPAHNRGTDPAGAPASCYSFYARNPADDHYPPVITGTTQYNDTVFTGPFPVSANVVDSCSVDTVLLSYRFNTGAETTARPDSVRGSVYYLTIPAAAMNTFIRYKLRAVDGSPNHNAAVDPASGYYSFNVVDGAGPTFSGTTELYDTSFAGPFPVQSQIADPSGVQWARIFYKLGSVAWDSLASDSANGATWWFHVPQVPSPMSVRYYLKAADNSQNHNVATDPQGAPSSYYVFFCNAAVAEPNGATGLRSLRLSSINPGVVLINLPVSGRLSMTVYDIKGSVVATLSSGQVQAGMHTLPMPAGLADGTYVLRTSWGDQQSNRSFVVSR